MTQKQNPPKGGFCFLGRIGASLEWSRVADRIGNEVQDAVHRDHKKDPNDTPYHVLLPYFLVLFTPLVSDEDHNTIQEVPHRRRKDERDERIQYLAF